MVLFFLDLSIEMDLRNFAEAVILKRDGEEPTMKVI